MSGGGVKRWEERSMEWNEVDTCEYEPESKGSLTEKATNRMCAIAIGLGNLLLHGSWIVAAVTHNMYFLWGILATVILGVVFAGVIMETGNFTSLDSHMANEERLIATGRWERVYREDAPMITFLQRVGGGEG
jgi:hypothetical protein